MSKSHGVGTTSHRLRPATAPGEDRNLAYHRQCYELGNLLRPATAPGEDRNAPSPPTTAPTAARLRPATAPGEDRNTVTLPGWLATAGGCARPPRRARIATRTDKYPP
ncbi:hypothetical protein [Micromonospora wenchangensis]|uniref:hypothetical protein n=1 Tax=Micromonospora wenchangensis TaxID=1185415 RepID=UPI003F4DCD52